MTSSSTLRACATALTCLGLSTPALAAEVFEPTLLSAETFAESFTLSVDLGRGMYLQGQLAISNLGPGDGQGACRFLVVGADGQNKSVGDKFDRKQWGFTKSPDPTLKVGPCRLVARGNSVIFEAPLDGGKVRATVHAAVASVRPPDHRVTVKDAFYETEILVPWAKVDVEVDVPGVSLERKSGFGLLDHSRSTTLPGQLASRWVRFRALDPDHGRLFLVRYPQGDGAPQAWSWISSESGPTKVSRVKVGSKPAGKAPQFRTLAMVDGKTWKMTSGKLIYRYAPVESHGMLGKIVGSVVGNPVTYTYVGRLEAGGETFTGVMEVTLID